MGNNLLGWQASGVYNSKHLSSLSTIGSTTTSNHCNSSLMPLNPLAPAFLPHHQSSSGPPLSLRHSDTMNLPLAQLMCGLPPQPISLLDPSIPQQTIDSTLLQPTNQSPADATTRNPICGSSAPLSFSSQYQSNCLQAINRTIKQLSQHLMAEQLDRQALQLILLQLQNDFAVLRYLLFSPIRTLSNKDITVKDTATSPFFDTNAHPNPNPNPNPNPSHHSTSSAFPLPGPRAPTLRRPTPVGAVGTPKTKTILQKPISNPYLTRKKQRYRTSHQEFANWKNYLPMKYQRTHPSLQGSTLNTFYYTIKFASLNLATQMLLFGRSP